MCLIDCPLSSGSTCEWLSVSVSVCLSTCVCVILFLMYSPPIWAQIINLLKHNVITYTDLYQCWSIAGNQCWYTDFHQCWCTVSDFDIHCQGQSTITYDAKWSKKFIEHNMITHSCFKSWLHQIDGLVQDCSNSIANALELLQSCAKSLKCCIDISRTVLTP